MSEQAAPPGQRASVTGRAGRSASRASTLGNRQGDVLTPESVSD